jgi:glutamyl-tRNA reductase
VKINSAIAELYDKYYKHAKRPPFKMVLQAYKSHGFSNEFLQRIEKNNEKRKREALRIEKIFTKIFDKEPTKKVKKAKKKEEPELNEDVVEPIEDEDQPPKSDEPEEEETLDVEPDEEDEEEVEEEYVSDGE